MSYSQKSLIDLMKAGKLSGEFGLPKHIQTVISNVFIFDTKVYKFYKNDNDFFNKGFRDISGNDERFSFTEKDFKWNRTLSPSIYINLMDVAVRNNNIIEVSREEAEEIMMIMNRVDTHDVLYEKLMGNKITEENCFEIGKQLGSSLRQVEIKLPNIHNYYEIFGSRITDLRNFISPVSQEVGEKECASWCDFLENFREKNRFNLGSMFSSAITYIGDVHSHNAVFVNNSLYLMDTFAPKEIWMIGHPLEPVYRLGVDLWVLGGNSSLFESFIKGYEESRSTKIDRKFDPIFVVWASSIMVSYLHMLKRTDSSKSEAASKFLDFIREYFAKLK